MKIEVELAHIEDGRYCIMFFFEGNGPLRTELLGEKEAKFYHRCLSDSLEGRDEAVRRTEDR